MTQCSTEKVCYKTEDHAAAELDRRAAWDYLQMYRCKLCGLWHLASIKNKLKQEIESRSGFMNTAS